MAPSMAPTVLLRRPRPTFDSFPVTVGKSIGW